MSTVPHLTPVQKGAVARLADEGTPWLTIEQPNAEMVRCCRRLVAMGLAVESGRNSRRFRLTEAGRSLPSAQPERNVAPGHCLDTYRHCYGVMCSCRCAGCSPTGKATRTLLATEVDILRRAEAGWMNERERGYVPWTITSVILVGRLLDEGLVKRDRVVNGVETYVTTEAGTAALAAYRPPTACAVCGANPRTHACDEEACEPSAGREDA